MPRIFNVPFATQGDRTEVPEGTQGDGSVSLTQGFGFDYEREYEDPDAKDIARDVLNGLLHDITQSIGHLQLSNIQFANYDPNRDYETGEVVRGDDGVFYEFYDRDLAGTVQGVDPTDSANRPHIWMRWDGNRSGQTIPWRSETLPEGYIVNDGDDYSRTDYRRIYDAWGTTHGEGDGETTFGSPDDRGEFLRGWDNGRGVDPGRELAEHQTDELKSHDHDIQCGDGTYDGTGIPQTGRNDFFVYMNKTEFTGGNETRPRNQAVIWLTKI